MYHCLREVVSKFQRDADCTMEKNSNTLDATRRIPQLLAPKLDFAEVHVWLSGLSSP